MTNETEEYLEHHGILGQKWGRRRGKNYPLSAGEHSSAEASKGTKGWTKEAKAEAPKVGKFATIFKSKKNASKSEKDKPAKKEETMEEATKRLNKEADYYRALSANQLAKSQYASINKKGESAVKKAMKEAVISGGKDALTYAIKTAGQKAVDKMLEEKKTEDQKRYEKAEKENKYWQNIKQAQDNRHAYEDADLNRADSRRASNFNAKAAKYEAANRARKAADEYSYIDKQRTIDSLNRDTAYEQAVTANRKAKEANSADAIAKQNKADNYASKKINAENMYKTASALKKLRDMYDSANKVVNSGEGQALIKTATPAINALKTATAATRSEPDNVKSSRWGKKKK